MNVIDSAVEKTKSLQGFLITHSIGGGSGSGLGSLILERLRTAYPKKKIFTFSVAPSPLISDSAVEPYNAVLTLQRIRDNADAAVLLDNEALFRIAKSKLHRAPSKDEIIQAGGIDQTTRDHIRNTDLQLGRLVDEVGRGRVELSRELRNEIKLVARTIAIVAGEPQAVGD